jgi:transposase
LERAGVVVAISRQTVQRRLAAHALKPWRTHAWLYPRADRDPTFAERTRAVADLLTRPLAPDEVVVSLDEMTSLQPRPRLAPTRPARPGRPVQVEHEYARAGALHLFAAIDTRSGRVVAECFARRSQNEYLVLLEDLDRATPPAITTIHLLADNGSIHHGQETRRWLTEHPRFVAHFTPTHCSWMNPVEQWFSILRRKRLRYSDFADLSALARAIRQFVREWNEIAHPFRWTTKAFAKILARLDVGLPKAA